MMTIEQMIDRQRGVVAEEERRLAQRGINPAATPNQMHAATVAATEQHEHLAMLLARKTARDQAITDHEAAEQEHADDLVLLGRELENARHELAERVSAAIEALDAAWRAGGSYDQLLAERSAWLRSVGMPARFKENSDDEVRFETGGNESTAMGRPHLVLAGQWWSSVHPRAVAQYVLAAVIAGRQYLAERRTSPLHELLDPVTRRPATVQQ